MVIYLTLGSPKGQWMRFFRLWTTKRWPSLRHWHPRQSLLSRSWQKNRHVASFLLVCVSLVNASLFSVRCEDSQAIHPWAKSQPSHRAIRSWIRKKPRENKLSSISFCHERAMLERFAFGYRGQTRKTGFLQNRVKQAQTGRKIPKTGRAEIVLRPIWACKKLDALFQYHSQHW